MDSDVAKSTKYSVYAAAGVYGKPILITPLIQSEINDLNKLDLDDGIYENIKPAVKAANRATLEVWALDKIADKIKEKIK
ncbi:MAG: hypothetical protein HC880_04630 [Bacteroidia bacterium]|nr:hypothetical protein [Bacteroidia bacterium]